MTDEFTCQACGGTCKVEGEYPRFYCDCENCRKQAEGFDVLDYAAQYLSEQIDQAEYRFENER